MFYTISMYNSIDRSIRDMKAGPLTRKQASFMAKEYFTLIEDEGISGEPDVLHLIPLGGALPTHTWSRSSQRWVRAKG